MTRVVIVGAGLLGASVGHRVARPGVELTIVEGRRPASGTSGASFAWANAQDKKPAHYFDLNARGVEAYPELAATLGGDWWHAGGDLVVGRGPDVERVRERIARHAALGYPVRELDRDGIAALEPELELGTDDVVGAYFEREGWVDVPVLVARLLTAARASGARLVLGDPVADIELDDGRATGVRLGSGGRLDADVVVVAAGPATGELVAPVGVTLPTGPTPGLLAFTAPHATALARVVHAEGVSLRPDGGGRILLAARAVDETLAPDTRAMTPDDPAARAVVERAARVLPALRDVPLETVRIGVRSVPADGRPAVGFVAGVDNLYVLMSHSGVSLAPVLGPLVAAELLGERSDDLEPYRPARFTAS